MYKLILYIQGYQCIKNIQYISSSSDFWSDTHFYFTLRLGLEQNLETVTVPSRSAPSATLSFHSVQQRIYGLDFCYGCHFGKWIFLMPQVFNKILQMLTLDVERYNCTNLQQPQDGTTSPQQEKFMNIFSLGILQLMIKISQRTFLQHYEQ